MNILITGGEGLIGSEFSDCSKTNRKEFNLIEKSEVKKLLQKYQPEYIIHTAAKVGGVVANLNYPADFFYDNIMMNTNIIEESKNYGVKKLICFLSTCVFPNEIDYPLDENKIHKGEPHFSNAPYAYAKRMAEVQIQAYNKQYGTNYFSVIPTNVYGPNDNYNLNNSHVIPGIIHKCYLALKNDSILELWGDGTPLREFIYSKDVADICKILLKNYSETEPIIISTSDEISIKEISNLIAKIMGYKKKIRWDTTKPNGQERKPSNNKKLMEIIGDFQFTKIEDGLSESIEYFIKNYEKLRK